MKLLLSILTVCLIGGSCMAEDKLTLPENTIIGELTISDGSYNQVFNPSLTFYCNSKLSMQINEDDIASMNSEELVNFSILINICKTMTFAREDSVGNLFKKLLPRIYELKLKEKTK